MFNTLKDVIGFAITDKRKCKNLAIASDIQAVLLKLDIPCYCTGMYQEGNVHYKEDNEPDPTSYFCYFHVVIVDGKGSDYAKKAMFAQKVLCQQFTRGIRVRLDKFNDDSEFSVQIPARYILRHPKYKT